MKKIDFRSLDFGEHKAVLPKSLEEWKALILLLYQNGNVKYLAGWDEYWKNDPHNVVIYPICHDDSTRYGSLNNALANNREIISYRELLVEITAKEDLMSLLDSLDRRIRKKHT